LKKEVYEEHIKTSNCPGEKKQFDKKKPWIICQSYWTNLYNERNGPDGLL
jgi:hypothetical protein